MPPVQHVSSAFTRSQPHAIKGSSAQGGLAWQRPGHIQRPQGLTAGRRAPYHEGKPTGQGKPGEHPARHTPPPLRGTLTLDAGWISVCC